MVVVLVVAATAMYTGIRLVATAASTAHATAVIDTFDTGYTSARGMCTLSGDGRVLFCKDCDRQLPCASTTKILTAITAIENCGHLDIPIEIDPKSVGVEGTSIYLQKGEKLTIRELLYGLMLRSGNDAATAIALHVGKCAGKNFVELMNETAIKAGAVNSNFKNPHGLDQEGHYTTAKDLALISAYAMKNKTFCEIVSTKQTKISGMAYPRVIKNKNRLLNGMENCVGIKTGFTKKAGRCYVGAIREDDLTVICCVLNCGPMFEEAAELMDDGMDILQREKAAGMWFNQNNVS